MGQTDRRIRRPSEKAVERKGKTSNTHTRPPVYNVAQSRFHPDGTLKEQEEKYRKLQLCVENETL